MSRSGTERALSASESVYRALLVLYPEEHRDEYGPHMVQVFRDSCRYEVGRAGVLGLVALWARTALDLLSTAVTERNNVADGGGFAIPLASSPKMIRWGGLAAMVGGVFGITALVLSDLSVAYTREPIMNALSNYQDGSSQYSRLIVLLHPFVAALLSTLSVLLFAMGFVGLYALVYRRSGRTASWGGLLMCLWVAVLAVFTMASALNLSKALVGALGWVTGTPLTPLLSVGYLAGFAGYLLLGAATLRTRSLGGWSILPLALLPLSLLLRLLVIRMGFPVTDTPQAFSEGLGTVVIVELPEAISYLGWMVLGYLLWSASGKNEAPGEAVVDREPAGEVEA